MKPTALYRTAASVLLLFALGHTVGFLTLKPTTADAVAVRDSMDNVHFAIHGKTFTYGGFYRGFGLFVTVYLLFSAFLAWELGTMSRRLNPEVSRALGAIRWAFAGVQLVTFALSWIYFAAAPALLSAGVAACLVWATVVVRRSSV